MNTGEFDRNGKEFKLGDKLRPHQDGLWGRISTVISKNEKFYVDIPNYKAWDEYELELSTYLREGKEDGWEFEIIKD